MDAALERTGLTFYFLGRRDLPLADRQARWASRLEGTVVLMSSEREIVTVYRHRKALPTIRRKMKYRLDLPTKGYRKHASQQGPGAHWLTNFDRVVPYSE